MGSQRPSEGVAAALLATGSITAVFFRACQRTLDGTSVNGESESLSDAIDKRWYIHRIFSASQLRDESHDLIGDLVRTIRTTFVG